MQGRMRTRGGMTAIKLWIVDECLNKLTEEAETKGLDRQMLIGQILANHFTVLSNLRLVKSVV